MSQRVLTLLQGIDITIGRGLGVPEGEAAEGTCGSDITMWDCHKEPGEVRADGKTRFDGATVRALTNRALAYISK